MTVYKFTVLVIIGLFCLNGNSYAQTSADWPDAEDAIDSLLFSLLNTDITSFQKKISASPQNIKAAEDSLFYLKDSSSKRFSRNDLCPLKRHPLRFNGGYFSYQWIQRTGADTPFIETNSSQHLLQGSFPAVLADAIPVRVSYVERHSNSRIFKDFRDFKIEFDAQGFFNMQRAKVQKRVGDFENKLQKPSLKPALDQTNHQLNTITSILSKAVIRKKYIDSKEMLLSPDVLDTLESNKKDSLLMKAEDFVRLYEKLETKKDSLRHQYDSLRTEFIQTQGTIKSLRSLASGRVSPPDMNVLKDSLLKAGLSEKDIRLLSEPASAVKTFAIGRTLPNFSNLTLKNTNVKGLNFEYNKNNFYTAAAIGKIDLRSRDFIYRGSVRPDQYVYSFRVGYGKKEGDHLIATYYEGHKQISLTSIHSASLIRGSSIDGQLFLFKNTRANIEFAQSFASYIYDSSHKPTGKAFDKNSQALSVGIRSYVPATKTKLEANYTRQGANFQNFAGYRINGAVDSWYVKAEQDFFKKIIHLAGSVRKNDLSNPFVIQRYNASSVVKNISASFRKRNFPTITFAMMPSSQYTLVENQIYENQYQSFSGSVFHIYTYDANGNIKSMWQKGWKITGSDYIDKLSYHYQDNDNSNKLMNVVDDMQDKDTKLGDFRYSSLYEQSVSQTKAATVTDYYYDDNGNMVKDLNKDIETSSGGNGIEYNYLNLPQKITVKASSSADKGTISYIYDAAGNKLQKITVDKSVSGKTVTTTTTYLGAFIYESKQTSTSAPDDYNNRLQLISMDEGRIRPVRDANNNITSFTYDYFIKDHLGNVRMVLTDETKTDPYETLTFEDININQQNALWENRLGNPLM